MRGGRVVRLRDRSLAAAARWLEDLSGRTRPGPDGLPLPPPARMRSVSGAADVEWFLAGGRAAADDLEQALARAGRGPESVVRALDFGCGCGRVLRHLRPWAQRLELHGCDADRAAVRWTARHLGFVRVVRNGLAPPLPYPDAHFGLVWALSVFTHLPEPLERAWLAELRRILRPGGLLVATLHGEANARRLAEADLARFTRGERVTVGGRHAGSNDCNAFHPESYLRAVFARGWRLLEWLPAGARGTPPQDLVVLERPPAQ